MHEYEKVKLEKVIAMAYVFCLPLRMIDPFSFLQNYLGGLALNFDLFFHAIGLGLWFLRGEKVKISKEKSELFAFFLLTMGMLIFISMFNAIHYHDAFGIMYGENTFQATKGQLLYWCQYILMAIYNLRVVYLLGMDTIWKIIDFFSDVMLLVGYIQILVIVLEKHWICALYNIIARLFYMLPSSYLLEERRIVLMEMEPAHAGYTIARLILPLLLARLICKGINGKNVTKMVIWLPVIYYTKSSNMYILLSVELMLFLIIVCSNFFRKNKHAISRTSCMVISFAVFVMIPLTTYCVLKGKISEIIYYLAIKLTDKSNMSTAWRTVPLYTNWEIFKQFPLLGVGNGNQGFFYWEYFPKWAYELLKDTKTMQAYSGQMTNGQLFFPSVLSGVGLIGSGLLLIYFITIVWYVYRKKNKDYMCYYFFIIAAVGIIVNGFSADFVAAYDVWFVLCLPVAAFNSKVCARK